MVLKKQCWISDEDGLTMVQSSQCLHVLPAQPMDLLSNYLKKKQDQQKVRGDFKHCAHHAGVHGGVVKSWMHRAILQVQTRQDGLHHGSSGRAELHAEKDLLFASRPRAYRRTVMVLLVLLVPLVPLVPLWCSWNYWSCLMITNPAGDVVTASRRESRATVFQPCEKAKAKPKAP